ncbi:hypothetical protein FACS1894181_13090 [Bacteroidia bacterium]|nr:hypothetical protein FACS1894181_13090 [Bacteroidia bacterium]
MIIDINIARILNKLHNGEHFGFGEEVIENIKADVEDIPLAKADWDKYEAAVSLEGVMYKQSPESPETKDIAEFDTQRERYWAEMLHKLKFEEKNLDENVRKAVAQIMFIMKKYSDLPKSNLFEETISMRKVLKELKAAENNAATALINGFDGLILAAEEINETLHTLYDKRLKDKEKIKELGTLVDFRKVVDKLFITFLESVNAIHRVNELGAKNPTIQAAAERIRLQLAALLAQLQKILDRRHPKPGSGKQKPDITNPEVPGTDTPDPEDPGEGGDGEGGDPGEGGDGEGGTENPDIENPPLPPFLPDFE